MEQPNAARPQPTVAGMVVSIVATVLTLISLAWSAITFGGMRHLLGGSDPSPGRLLTIAIQILAPALFAGAVVSLLPIARATKRILGLPPLVPPILLFALALLLAHR